MKLRQSLSLPSIGGFRDVVASMPRNGRTPPDYLHALATGCPELPDRELAMLAGIAARALAPRQRDAQDRLYASLLNGDALVELCDAEARRRGEGVVELFVLSRIKDLYGPPQSVILIAGAVLIDVAGHAMTGESFLLDASENLVELHGSTSWQEVISVSCPLLDHSPENFVLLLRDEPLRHHSQESHRT